MPLSEPIPRGIWHMQERGLHHRRPSSWSASILPVHVHLLHLHCTMLAVMCWWLNMLSHACSHALTADDIKA